MESDCRMCMFVVKFLFVIYKVKIHKFHIDKFILIISFQYKGKILFNFHLSYHYNSFTKSTIINPVLNLKSLSNYTLSNLTHQ